LAAKSKVETPDSSDNPLEAFLSGKYFTGESSGRSTTTGGLDGSLTTSKATVNRNRTIYMEHLSGFPVSEIATKYGISDSRVRQIIFWERRGLHSPKRGGELSEIDFQMIRNMVAKYGLDKLILELARIATNYGNTSKRWSRVGASLRTAIARWKREQG